MKINLKQGWDSRGDLVCHLAVQTRETNAAVKVTDQGELRVRLYDRQNDEMLYEKSFAIGKSVREVGSGEE